MNITLVCLTSNWNDVSPAVTSFYRTFLGEFQVDWLKTLSPHPPLGKPVVAIIVQIGRMEFPPVLTQRRHFRSGLQAVCFKSTRLLIQQKIQANFQTSMTLSYAS